MAHVPELRAEAVKLRAKGISVNAIASRLKISLSTASLWVRDVPISETQHLNLRARLSANSAKAHAAWLEIGRQRRDRWKAEAEELWKAHASDPLFALGLGLYWGEGSKTSKSLSLVNSDPGLLRVWLRWCTAFIPNVPLRFRIQAHADVLPVSAVRFWRRELGITSHIAFSVNRPTSSKGKAAKVRPLRYGVLTVTARKGSSEWWHKMMRFLELASV